MADSPKIKIVRLEKKLITAIKIIDKFLTINDLDIKYSITLDYSLKDFGVFYPDSKSEITINPSQFYDTSLEDPHSYGYSCDFDLISVCLHEFFHMLDCRLGLSEKYRARFKEKFILNDNSNKNRYEELVEALRIFALNPFFLKLINREVFDFFCIQFQSPTPITKKNFLVKYKSWPKEIRELCLKQWGIKVIGSKIILDQK